MGKSIIFGANGYIGRHLLRKFIEQGEQVLASGKSITSKDSYEYYTSIDLCQKETLLKIDFNVESIYLFSSITGTHNSFENWESFIDVNVKGLLNILDHIKDFKVKPKIIFPSSRLVYKGKSGFSIKEDDIKEAKTIYAINKITCENILKAYNNYYGVPYIIFRICVPYGNLFDNQYSYGTTGYFINCIKTKNKISLYGDGSLKRTFTHISDIVDIIFKVSKLKDQYKSIYNIGSSDNLSLFAVAEMFKEKFNNKIEFVPWPSKDLLLESGDTIFNDNRIKEVVDIDYKYEIRKWINTLNIKNT